MVIPEAYHGQWEGMVQDSSRKKLYPCTLELHAHGGAVMYNQAKGQGASNLIPTGRPLEFTEEYIGPEGGSAPWTIRLNPRGADELLCEWLGTNPKQEVAATVRRVRSTHR